jgi:hypothetical protein
MGVMATLLFRIKPFALFVILKLESLFQIANLNIFCLHPKNFEFQIHFFIESLNLDWDNF